MQKRDVPYLVLGFLITAVACRSSPENDLSTLEQEWLETSTPINAANGQAAATDAPAPADEPPLPSPPLAAGDWLTLGSPRAGLSLVVPADWVNLSDQGSAPAMGNRLGIELILAADSERTGRSLLVGKAFTDGAYISGLTVAAPAGVADPAAALVELLATAAPSAVRLTTVAPLQSANGVEGLAVDVADGPVGLTISDANELRTRVVLFMPPAAREAAQTWIILLLSATTERWDQYTDLFDHVLQSVEVYDVASGETAQAGHVVVRGELTGERDEVRAHLERGVHDVWTFSSMGNRYVSLRLRPDEPHLDLTLTLLGPDRQTVARIENGYEGMMESTADLWLPQSGVYIVEISDFAQAAGRYSLALQLSGQPAHSEGGTLAFGQALQTQLPANAQHNWVFSAAARQHVSIVVEPETQTFDAILELYDPDGTQLLVLDEGFSGDPELISGYELPVAGEYAIVVRSFSPQGGPYTVSLDEGDRPIENFYDAGDLVYGNVRQESLQRQEAQAWFIQGKAGDHVLIRVAPLDGNLDLTLWLLDDRVERIAAVDEFTAGEPETIELTLSADGQYIALVRDFNGRPGAYEIVLGAAPVATPENAGTLSYGDTVMSTLRPGTTAAWTFNAEAGDVIDIDVDATSPDSDIVLQLQGPDGLTIQEVDQNSAGGDEVIRALVVPVAGSWHIVLREYFGDMAGYRLELSRTQ
ncbi:MAG: PPC domain-containing protein [Chloroflexota bacterium]